MEDRWEWLRREMAGVSGLASCWFRDLKTGETFGWQEEAVHSSASIIKIFLMAFLFRKFGNGELRPEDLIELRPELIAPSAGVLSYLRDVRELSVRDLIELMIIVSDNSATNVLIDLAGMDALNAFLAEELGLKQTRLRRRMMDLDAIARGRDNTTSALEAGIVLERIRRGTLISPEASREMLRTLKNQQDSSLIPWVLREELPEHTIAHKTGGLDHVVHDAAIVDLPERPYILCFFGSGVSVPEYGRLMQDASDRIYREQTERKG
jgi:beta-lactamase class A